MSQRHLRASLPLFLVIACGAPPHEAEESVTEQGVWVNGDFENDAIGVVPSGWTRQVNLNPGITDTRPGPQTLASLNLAAGGTAMTFVVGGASESQSDPDVTASGTLRFPRYGARAARVNYLNTTTTGKDQNVNLIRQTMTVGLGDVDPSDDKVHVRFAIAPVLENPNHNYREQPYYFVRLQNLTSNTTLYQDFNASGQPGVPWKDFTSLAGNAGQYTDWQLVDISPGNGVLSVGDSVEILVAASGCSLGGHFGRVYVDAVGSGVPGLYAWATGPQNANAGSDITYTINYKNGGLTTATGTKVDFVTPPNTNFQAVSLGAACTTPAVGATGTVSCSIGSLANGAVDAFTVRVRIPGATANGTVITNGNYSIYATGQSALVGPKVNTTVTSSVSYADVSVAGGDGKASVAWGAPTSYTLTVANAGPVAAGTVNITDAMPAQLTGVTWTCSATGGGTCPASGNGNIAHAISLPIGAVATYVISASIIAGTGTGSVRHTMTAAVAGGVSDPDTTNNSSIDNTAIGTPRTLTLTRTGAASLGSVVSTPAGLSCGTSCSGTTASFNDGSQVMLTASPEPGATFVGWTGACSGSATQCTFTMTGDQSVGAAFVGPPSTSTTGGSGQSTTVSTAFGQPLAVTVRDATGAAVPGITVTFSVPGAGASATPSSTTAVTNAAGVASITVTANATPGAYSVTATVPGIAGSVAFALSNIGPPTQIALSSGSPQSTAVTTAFASPLAVLVRDAANQPVPNATVSYAVPGAGASATRSAPTASTNASGIASITATANTIAGAYSVTASVAGVGTTVPFALTNTPGAPATLAVVSGGGQSATVTTAFTNPLVASLSDAQGNPIAGATIAFSAPGSGATASLSTPAVTNAQGRASVTATAGTVAGGYSITASSAGVSNASFALTNTAGAAAAVAISGGDGQSTTVSTAFAQPLAVLVTDAQGNPVAGASIAFAGPASGARATFVSPATSNAAGLASVTATANTIAGTYSVTATLAGKPPASFSLTNTAGAAAAITAVSGGGQSAIVGAAFTAPLVAQVTDSNGNLVAGATVTFGAPASGARATFAPASAVSDALGRVSTTPTAGTVAGGYNATASLAGGASASFALTNTAGAPASIAVSGGGTQSTTVNTAFGAPLAVVVRDAQNNPVSGVTVTYTAPASGPSAAPSAGTAVTNASGIASVTATANTAAGTYTVTASSGALSADFTLTNTAGAAASVAVSSGSGQSAQVTVAFAAPLVAIVRDQFANPVSGATVSYAVPGAGASATRSAPTASTNASGLASITVTANTIAGAYAATASVAGVATPASFSLTNTPGAPATLAVVSGGGQSAAVTTAFAAPLVASLADAQGNPIAGATIAFSAPATGATASLSTPAVTDAQGRASVTATAGTLAGGYSITASSGGLSAGFALTNTAGPAASVAVSGGDGQSTTISTAFAQPLAVIVRDAQGNPVAGASIAFAGPASGARATFVSPATSNASGLASVTATANTIAGTYTVTATLAGKPPASFTLTNTAGAAAAISAVSGGGQSATVGAAFAAPLVAQVTDASGNVVAGATVTFGAPATGARATFAPASAVTDSLGRVSTTATAGTVAGAFSATASLAGGASASFALTNTAGAPASIAVSGGGTQSTTVATAFGAPLAVVVRDAQTNPVAGVTVTYAVPGSGPTASTSTGTAVTNASGIASVTATAGQLAGAYTVTASSGALSAGFSLTNTAGAAASVAVSSGSGQSAQVTVAFAAPLVAIVRDQFSNPVSGATVSFTAPAGLVSATLGAASAITGSDGRAQVSATAKTRTGAYAVTASVAGVATSASFSLTNTAGPAATVVAVGGGAQSAVVGTAFANPLVVEVRDAQTNLVAGQAVGFAAPGTGPSATVAASATTAANGRASVTATAGTTAGSYAVTATITGLTAATFALTNTPGAAAAIEVASGDAQTTTVADPLADDLVVLVTDAHGNPVPNASVSLVAPASSGPTTQLAASQLVTDDSGLASTSATAGTRAGAHDVTASITGASTAFHLTNRAGAPAAVRALAASSPQSATVLTDFASELVAIVEDRFGNPCANAAVVFAAPATGATATLGTPSVTTGTDGRASTVAAAGSRTGSYIATATVAGVADPAAFALTNTAGAPASVTAETGASQSAVVDTMFASPLGVRVLDAQGNAVPNAMVTFTAPAGAVTGVLTASVVATDATGRASTAVKASRATGSYTVTASVPSGAAPAPFALQNLPGAPAAIAPLPLATPQNATVATAYPAPLAVIVVDAFGNPVPGVAVSYGAPAGGPTGTLSGPTAVTGPDGHAQVTILANTTAGPFNVVASITGVAGSATFVLRNLAGAATTIEVRDGSLQSTIVATPFASPLVAYVHDAFGNPVPATSVTFAPPASGARAALSATTVTTTAAGEATVTATASTTAGAYQVIASTPTGATPVAFQLTNLPGAPAAASAHLGSTPQVTEVGHAFAQPLVVVVVDAHGNRVPGATLDLVAPATGPSAQLSDGHAATGSDGTASVVAIANASAGSYLVVATVGGVAVPVPFDLTNTPAAPSGVVVIDGAGQSAMATTKYARPLALRAVDALGNPVPGATIELAMPEAGPSATPSDPAPVTDEHGDVAVELTANASPGAFTVLARIPGASSPTAIIMAVEAIPTSVAIDTPDELSVDTELVALVTVTAPLGTPGGDIELLDDAGTVIATTTLDERGSAGLHTTLAARGSHRLVARYPAQGAYAGSMATSATVVAGDDTGSLTGGSTNSCNAGGGGSALGFALVMIALLVARRRSPRKALAVAAILIAPAIASAQPAGSRSIDRLHAASAESDWFALDSLGFGGHREVALSVTGDYAYRPLVIYNGDGTARADVVHQALVLHAAASVSLFDRLRLSATAPMSPYQEGEGGTFNGMSLANPTFAFGDVTVAADVRVAGAPHSRFRAAAGVRVQLPTGSRTNYMSDGVFAGEGRALVAGTLGAFEYAADARLLLREESSLAGLMFGSELRYSVAAGARLARGRLVVGPEVIGATPISADRATGSPFEVGLGAHYRASRTVRVGLGASSGLVRAVGTPDARAMLSLAWFP